MTILHRHRCTDPVGGGDFVDLLRVPWPTAATDLSQHAGAGGPLKGG